MVTCYVCRPMFFRCACAWACHRTHVLTCHLCPQLELFRALKKNPSPIGRNYRPPQARYGRSVYLSQPEQEEVETISFGGKTAAVRSAAPATTAGSLAALLATLMSVRLLL